MSINHNDFLIKCDYDADYPPYAERQKARDEALMALKEERCAGPVPEEITGELHDWKKQPIPGHEGEFVIWGRVYNDSKGRWPDGHWIRTSLISRVEGDLAITLNSVYRLVGEDQ